MIDNSTMHIVCRERDRECVCVRVLTHMCRVDHILKSELCEIQLASDLREINRDISIGMCVHTGLHMSLSFLIYSLGPL